MINKRFLNNLSKNSESSDQNIDQDITLPPLNITNNTDDINQTLQMIKLRSRSVLRKADRWMMNPLKVKSKNQLKRDTKHNKEYELSEHKYDSEKRVKVRAEFKISN